MLISLQIDVLGSGLFALLLTLALAWLFYAITLHLAALYVIGEVPHQRAAAAAFVPAVVSILLQRYSPAVVIPVTLVSDSVAIYFAYRLQRRATVILTLAHFTIATLIGIALYNVITLLS